MRYISHLLKGHTATFLLVASVGASSLLTTYCRASDLLDQRPSAEGGGNVELVPQGQTPALRPLSSNDVVRIRAAFANQSSGHFEQADALLQQMEDKSLIGTVLAERCLHVSYACSTPMLQDWVAQYAGLPEAPLVQALLDTRKNVPLAALAKQPVASKASFNATAAQNLYVMGQDRAVLNKVQSAPILQDKSGQVAFYAGLSAWRLKELPQAQALFVRAANAEKSSKDLRSAAAWWASRTAEHEGNAKEALLWLMQSAQCKDCFYGVLARHALNKSVAPTAPVKAPTATDIASIATRPAGHRALALLQVGRTDLAEAELRTDLVDAAQTTEHHSIEVVAHTVSKAVVTSATAHHMGASKLVPGHVIDLPQRFAPRGGFVVDPALIYGIISIESRFQPHVVSKSGARGLMQLMPRTAANFADGRKENLNDPSANLLIGQRYLMALAQDNQINNHLIRLLASYAVGHTAVAHWSASARSQNDSLAFLEAIPKAPVRHWIETVLLHSWMYAEKLQRRPASLDSLAESKKAELPLEAETSFH